MSVALSGVFRRCSLSNTIRAAARWTRSTRLMTWHGSIAPAYLTTSTFNEEMTHIKGAGIKSCIPQGTEGTGQFTRGSQFSNNIANVMGKIVLDNVPKKEQNHSGTFVVCDYGCADGVASNDLFVQIVELLKVNFGEHKEIQFVYNDLPHNDFQSVFLQAHGLLGNKHVPLQFPKVYVTASGTSFGKQCLPSASVDLAISFMAVHWLSKRPPNEKLSTKVSFPLTEDHPNSEMRSIVSAADWESFLLNRAAELKPGSKAIIAVLHKQHSTWCEYFEKIFIDLVSENIISKKECDSIEINMYLRSSAEVEAPFVEPGSRVRAAGLQLVSNHHVNVPCVMYERYLEDVEKGEPRAIDTYCDAIARSIHTPFYNSILAGLSDKLSFSEKKEIMELMVERYKMLTLENPYDSRLSFDFSVVVAQKY